MISPRRATLEFLNFHDAKKDLKFLNGLQDKNSGTVYLARALSSSGGPLMEEKDIDAAILSPMALSSSSSTSSSTSSDSSIGTSNNPLNSNRPPTINLSRDTVIGTTDTSSSKGDPANLQQQQQPSPSTAAAVASLVQQIWLNGWSPQPPSPTSNILPPSYNTNPAAAAANLFASNSPMLFGSSPSVLGGGSPNLAAAALLYGQMLDPASPFHQQAISLFQHHHQQVQQQLQQQYSQHLQHAHALHATSSSKLHADAVPFAPTAGPFMVGGAAGGGSPSGGAAPAASGPANIATGSENFPVASRKSSSVPLHTKWDKGTEEKIIHKEEEEERENRDQEEVEDEDDDDDDFKPVSNHGRNNNHLNTVGRKNSNISTAKLSSSVENASNNNNYNSSSPNQTIRKYTCKYDIPIPNCKDFGVARRLIGTKGHNMKRIVAQTNAKLRLRGEGSGFLEGSERKESSEPLHICVSCPVKEGYSLACSLVEELLQSVITDYNKWLVTHPPFTTTGSKNKQQQQQQPIQQLAPVAVSNNTGTSKAVLLPKKREHIILARSGEAPAAPSVTRSGLSVAEEALRTYEPPPNRSDKALLHLKRGVSDGSAFTYRSSATVSNDQHNLGNQFLQHTENPLLRKLFSPPKQTGDSSHENSLYHYGFSGNNNNNAHSVEQPQQQQKQQQINQHALTHNHSFKLNSLNAGVSSWSMPCAPADTSNPALSTQNSTSDFHSNISLQNNTHNRHNNNNIPCDIQITHHHQNLSPYEMQNIQSNTLQQNNPSAATAAPSSNAHLMMNEFMRQQRQFLSQLCSPSPVLPPGLTASQAAAYQQQQQQNLLASSAAAIAAGRNPFASSGLELHSPATFATLAWQSHLNQNASQQQQQHQHKQVGAFDANVQQQYQREGLNPPPGWSPLPKMETSVGDEFAQHPDKSNKLTAATTSNTEMHETLQQGSDNRKRRGAQLTVKKQQ